MNRKSEIAVMNFSGIYERQCFYRKYEHQWIDLKNLSGTNCYCDEMAGDKIREAVENLPLRGIHFLDSGNYHYVSRFWMEKIQKPYQLLVFDNHTDLQPPAFGGLLSCGGWIADSLETLPELKRVILIGPDEEAWQHTEEKYRERICFLSREKLQTARQNGRMGEVLKALETDFEMPVYLSVDKDVLSREELRTNWSQGDMTLEELLDLIRELAVLWKENGTELLGADICGECDFQESGTEENDQANQKLLSMLKQCLEQTIVS
ncbi:MAG: arginase family protein [Blautia sp.]|nr:arginase family protein [Blautia sp.]MDY5032251.1 arginase family protein [Blautia sp.]